MIELLKTILWQLLIVYLVIGIFMSVISYMILPKNKTTSLSDHLVNLSFILFWLPYFYWYYKYTA